MSIHVQAFCFESWLQYPFCLDALLFAVVVLSTLTQFV